MAARRSPEDVAYDRGWVDCLKALKAVPAHAQPQAITQLLEQGPPKKLEHDTPRDG